MSKTSKLMKNTFVIGLGNLVSKLSQYFLVVLCTYKLTTSDYGIADIIVQTVNMIIPLASLDIAEAMFRFSMDKEENKNAVFTNALLINILGVINVILIVSVARLFGLIGESIGLIIFLTVFQMLQVSIKEFVRGSGFVQDYVIGGALNAITQIIFCIILVWLYSLGLIGYISALVIGNLVEIIYYNCKNRVFSNIKLSLYDSNLIKRMTKYSIPLAPNSIMWWVVTTSDRYFILFFCGASATGLYAVANKIPALITIISGLFFQAWQISAIEVEKETDKEDFYSDIFNKLWLVLILFAGLILVIIKPIVRLLVSSDFQMAWVYAPLLLVSSIFASLQSFFGVNYTVNKDTIGALKSTVSMAIINIGLNYMLIKLFGIQGAASATLISYMYVTVYRYLDTKKYTLVRIRKGKFISSLLLLIFSALFSVCNQNHQVFVSGIAFVSLCVINIKDLHKLICEIRGLLLIRITKKIE